MYYETESRIKQDRYSNMLNEYSQLALVTEQLNNAVCLKFKSIHSAVYHVFKHSISYADEGDCIFTTKLVHEGDLVKFKVDSLSKFGVMCKKYKD